MRLPGLPEAIAFSFLCLSATLLEINDKPASGLWVLIVFWAVFSSFGNSANKDKETP